MQDIEFVVAFAGLLFGLALANVTTSLADSWRQRKSLPLGPIPLLIAIYIVISIIDQWVGLAAARDVMQLNAVSVFAALGISLPLIFVSRILCPLHPEKWSTVEAYYIENRREFLVALAIPPFIATTANILSYIGPDISSELTIRTLLKGPLLLIPLGLIATTSIKWHRIGYVVLIVLIGVMIAIARQIR